jgi:AraC-like DNA-binding protein
MLSANFDWNRLAHEAHFHRRELAPLCHVSVGRLNAFFVEHFRRSPQEWMDELRIWEAFQNLCEGGSVKEVAYGLGFKQVSHFSKAFSKYHGIPPSSCRDLFLIREKKRLQFVSRISHDEIPESWKMCPVWIEAQQALALHDFSNEKCEKKNRCRLKTALGDNKSDLEITLSSCFNHGPTHSCNYQHE